MSKAPATSTTGLLPEFKDSELIVQAMASIGAVAWRWDLLEGSIQCSKELSELLGIELNADDGGLLGLLSDAEREVLHKAAQHAFDSRDVLEEQIHVHLGHGAFPFRFLGSRLDYGDDRSQLMAGVLIAGVDTGQLFNSILNNAQVLVYVKDLQGRYLFANQSYADACSQAASGFIGKTDREIFSLEHAETLRRLEKQVVVSGQLIQVEEQLSVANNQNVYLSGRFPITNSQGEVYAIGGILTDVTRLKKYQRTIRSQRQELHEVIDAIPAEVSQFNTRGQIVAMNQRARDKLCIGQRDVKGLTLQELFPDKPDNVIALDILIHCVENGQPYTSIRQRSETEGGHSWVRIELIPLRSELKVVAGLLLFVTDITDIKENEIQLARREASYSAFIASSSEAILGAELRPPMSLSLPKEQQLDWVMANLYCTEVNHISTQLLGHDITMLLGQPVAKIMRTENIERFHAYISKMLASNFQTNGFLCQMYDPDGQLNWFEFSARGRIEDGQLLEIWSVFRNVTEQRQQEQDLRRSEQRYRSFIAKSHEGIFSLQLYNLLDLRRPQSEQVEHILQYMHISECNAEFSRQHSHANKDSLFVDVFGEDLSVKLIAELIDSDCQLSERELEIINADGVSRWYLLHIDGIVENGCLTGCWGISRDITERHEYWNDLEFQANHDSLTLLPNRKALYTDIEKRLANLSEGKGGSCVALMLIDLDRFKEINDTLGHHIGDRLLKQLGPRLQSVISEYEGLVARLGGDEFAIVVTRQNEAEALEKAFKVLMAIRGTFELGGFRTDISASIGIAFAPKHGHNVSVLMRYADVAMYRAKTESVGVLEYDASFDEHTPKRLSLMTDLGRAIKEQQLYLVFQPKIDLAGKCLKGVEVLLRWRHPVHGVVPPDEFIPLAETSELIRPLTLWVLDAALAQCRSWRDQGLDIPVAVNLSTRNLHDENIVLEVRDALNRNQLSATSLELEITESAIMADPKRALRVLQMLDDLGVSLSIDDFGTGYSSLAYLKKLPVDWLKIDGSFVTDMLTDEQDSIIVTSTIHLAHNLGLRVIAEGVESEASLSQLQEMGCDLAQGYFIGRPMDAIELSAWLGRTAWLPARLN